MTQAQQSEAQRLAAICETKGMFPVADELNRMHARILELEQGKCLHQIAEPALTESVLIDGTAYVVHAEVAAELLRLHIELQTAPQAVQPAVPVGGQSRFKGEKDWHWCAAEHVAMVLATPSEWQNYEVRYVYAHPAEGVPAQAVEPVVSMLTFVNGKPAKCGCRFSYSDGGGEYSDVGSVTLCAMHAATQPAAQGLDVEPKLNAAWKARLLDGAPLSRDKYGCGSHPALPIFFEGVKCKDFFEALGIELRLWFAEYEMEAEAYEAMSDGFTEDGENYNAWTPKKPEGDGWCLVAIFDTEDGAACWWLRDAALAAQAKQGGADHG